jgi:hypothetical protein
MSVGVMKDYKLKLRDLRVSHTNLLCMNLFFRCRKDDNKSASLFVASVYRRTFLRREHAHIGSFEEQQNDMFRATGCSDSRPQNYLEFVNLKLRMNLFFRCRFVLLVCFTTP